MQYSENLNFNLPEMTDPPDISKLIENWSNLDPIIQNIIIGLTQVGNAAKVNGYTVNANVPEGAKFTDTVTTVNGKTGAITKADIVALGIPASDTNTTYTEITTSEIDAGTSSTLRTITGRRVKYILDKVQGWIGGLTKSDVGLSNVDNTKQMPLSGGTFSGIAKAYPNTSYTVAQVRNIILSTANADVSAMQDGDIWIKYE